MVAAKTGESLRPLQPAYLVFNAAAVNNVTGDGTVATVGSFTESFDQNADFATPTFTAPKTGIYLLSAQLRMGGITAGMTSGVVSIVTTANVFRSRFCNTNGIKSSASQTGFNMATLCPMS